MFGRGGLHEVQTSRGGKGVMSALLIKLLLVEYAGIMAACLFEKNYPKALYWLGASILQVSILWGFK